MLILYLSAVKQMNIHILVGNKVQYFSAKKNFPCKTKSLDVVVYPEKVAAISFRMTNTRTILF